MCEKDWNILEAYMTIKMIIMLLLSLTGLMLLLAIFIIRHVNVRQPKWFVNEITMVYVYYFPCNFQFRITRRSWNYYLWSWTSAIIIIIIIISVLFQLTRWNFLWNYVKKMGTKQKKKDWNSTISFLLANHRSIVKCLT